VARPYLQAVIWIYRLLFLPALLAAAPYYGARMLRRGGYATDFRHRLGLAPKLEPPPPGVARLWCQAVSVGEVHAIAPLVETLGRAADIEVVVTSTTSTGYREARKRFGGRVRAVAVFPLDFWPCSRAAWNRLGANAALLTESELWPEHLHQAARRGAPVALVNGRLSERSFARYARAPRAARRLFRGLTRVCASGALDAERFLALGAAAGRVTVCGNLKFDVEAGEPPDDAAVADLRRRLGFGDGGEGPRPFVVLGASTWPGEEAALLDARDRLEAEGVDGRLLLVPRHAERGGEVARLLERRNLPWHRRSTDGPSAPAGTRAHLADTTGELRDLTPAADVAFIGKSLPPHREGQTPIEAAAAGVPVIMGPGMANFRRIRDSLLASGAAREAADAAELADHLLALARDPDARVRMSAEGRAWRRDNQGSAARVLEILGAILGRDY